MRLVMIVTDLFKLAGRSLTENRLRSFLTLLGLVIGVSSLILVMTIIESANTYVSDQIADLGTNAFKVTKLANISDGIDAFIKSFRRKDITWENYEFLSDNLRKSSQIGAEVSTRNFVRFKNNYIEESSVDGWSANMIDIGTREIADGRFFSIQEQQYSRRICVIGWDIRKNLFENQDPIGQYIKIGATPYLVIGVCEEIGNILGQSQDNFVIIPITTFQKKYGQRRTLDLLVQTGSPSDMDAAIDEVRSFLRTLRHRKFDEDDDFSIITADTTLDLFHSISDNFFLVFLMLTAVAAIVGGIVIMNIMLVSVTERVMEIGVRRAVGARRRDILNQFLLESLLLCLVGGIIGVLLGMAGAYLFTSLADMPAGVEPWVAGFGVLLSSTIGIFFGIYPSWRAAGLDPVEALQAEK
jgi:putative ABC transport system permease protein